MDRISNIARLWLTFAVLIQLQVIDVVLGRTRTVQIVSSSDLGAGITVSSSSNSSSAFQLTFSFPRSGAGSDFADFLYTEAYGKDMWFSVGFQNGAEEESHVSESPTSVMTGPRGADFLFIVEGETEPKHRKLDKDVVGNVLPSLVTEEIGSSTAWIQSYSYKHLDWGFRSEISLTCTPRERAAQIVNFAEPVTVLFAVGLLSGPGEPVQHSRRHRAVVLRQTSTSTTLCPGVSGAMSTTATAVPSSAAPSTAASSIAASSTTAPSSAAPSTAAPSTAAPSKLGAVVLDAAMLDAAVLGAAVLGAAVLGAAVLGAAELSAAVLGAAVLGAAAAAPGAEPSNTTSSRTAAPLTVTRRSVKASTATPSTTVLDSPSGTHNQTSNRSSSGQRAAKSSASGQPFCASVTVLATFFVTVFLLKD